MIEAVELLSAQPPRFKVVPTPDHGTRLVPVDPTPKTEDEWLAAACEHDITYGQDSTPLGSHTPGPWIAGNSRGGRIYNRWGIYRFGARKVAVVCENNSPEIEHANARLIAAAPELLELAQFMVLNIGGYDPEKARDMARAAIAKATGGAQ